MSTDTEHEPSPFALSIPDTAPTVPARRKNHHHPAVTNTDPAWHRVEILKRAGFTPAVLAEITRESIAVLRDGLAATKKTVHTFRGKVVDVTEEPDHGVRGKSAERLMSILGINASPHNVQAPIVVQEAETFQLVLNMGNGTTVQLGATGSTAPTSEPKDVTPPHVDHNGRPLS